jgi:curved DNA-binding protein
MARRDYYEVLGVSRSASEKEIRQAYRKLARKYHPDVSKMADAESRFKDINEANEVLKDPEKRAAYDQMGSNWKAGQEFAPPPNWDAGFEFRGGQGRAGPGGFAGGAGFDASDFFESLFGRRGAESGGPRRRGSVEGEDHHAKVLIDVEDAYRGAERSISLRAPVETPDGRVSVQERTLDVHIPKGIRPGQHLRLAGQGAPGAGGAKAGDLYLEIEFHPHRIFRIEGSDVFVDLPLAPWEAALGATVDVPTPEGTVQLTVPKGSQAGRKLRLKGRGLPGKSPGDLYAVLAVVAPAADGDASRAAYEALARAFPDFRPRAPQQG